MVFLLLVALYSHTTKIKTLTHDFTVICLDLKQKNPETQETGRNGMKTGGWNWFPKTGAFQPKREGWNLC